MFNEDRHPLTSYSWVETYWNFEGTYYRQHQSTEMLLWNPGTITPSYMASYPTRQQTPQSPQWQNLQCHSNYFCQFLVGSQTTLIWVLALMHAWTYVEVPSELTQPHTFGRHPEFRATSLISPYRQSRDVIRWTCLHHIGTQTIDRRQYSDCCSEGARLTSPPGQRTAKYLSRFPQSLEGNYWDVIRIRWPGSSTSSADQYSLITLHSVNYLQRR